MRTQSELWSDDCFEQVSCTSVRACVVCVCVMLFFLHGGSTSVCATGMKKNKPVT